MKTKTAVLFFSVAVFAMCMAIVPARAENIDPLGDGSQYGYSENAGWLNAEPQGNGGPGVTVYDDRVEGYIWGENIGWINLSPAIYGGVTNEGDGGLSGYAWGENVGWINFAPAYGGVTIDMFTGRFSGWAWGENIGWINFNLTTQAGYAARTSWSLWGDDWDADPDGDGLVNLDDPDADDDGIDNDAEYAYWEADWNADPDNDLLINLLDLDSDNDGFTDGEEIDAGTDPATSNRAMPWIPLLLLD